MKGPSKPPWGGKWQAKQDNVLGRHTLAKTAFKLSDNTSDRVCNECGRHRDHYTPKKTYAQIQLQKIIVGLRWRYIRAQQATQDAVRRGDRLEKRVGRLRGELKTNLASYRRALAHYKAQRHGSWDKDYKRRHKAVRVIFDERERFSKWLGEETIAVAQPMAPIGRHAVGDLLVACPDGLTWIVHWRQTPKEPLTEGQASRVAKLRALGVEVSCLYTLEEAKKMFRLLNTGHPYSRPKKRA